jgi:hypothetical protein
MRIRTRIPSQTVIYYGRVSVLLVRKKKEKCQKRAFSNIFNLYSLKIRGILNSWIDLHSLLRSMRKRGRNPGNNNTFLLLLYDGIFRTFELGRGEQWIYEREL